MSTYDAVRTAFKSKPAPRPVLCDLVYHPPELDNSSNIPDMKPDFWTVRLYRENFDSFSGEDRIVIYNWVSDIIAEIRKIHPRCYIEAHERTPQ